MTNRLLRQGKDASYDEMIGALGEGEVLVATWLRDPMNTPNAAVVENAAQAQMISSKTEHGYYVQLRWYASVSGSTNPFDYSLG